MDGVIPAAADDAAGGRAEPRPTGSGPRTGPRRRADPDPAGRPLRWADVSPPAWLLRWALVATCLLVLAGAVWLLAELVSMLTLLVVAVVVALLLAGVLAPAVAWAGRHRVPRGAAAGLAVAVVVLVAGGVLALIGVRLAEQLPEFRAQLDDATSQLSATLGVEVPSPQEGGSSVSEALTTSVAVVADVLLGLFLVLVFLFLFLRHGERLWGWVLEKLGGRLREDVDAAAHAAWHTVGAYVRGLTIVAAFDAVGIGLGLVLLGVPLALTLAVLQFVASYVPTIGSIVAGAVAVAVAYVGGGLGTAAAVAVLALVVQQIGNNVIEPYVMQRRLPINAFVVLAAVTAGGLLWGIAGALLFVPLTAAVSAAGHELWTRHGRPPLVGGGATASPRGRGADV
ncbi:MAG: AI-2E family transporter [Actinotalea sp.]|nr:AI-2E family transporter [Actinotalea sp.]